MKIVLLYDGKCFSYKETLELNPNNEAVLEKLKWYQ